MLPISTDAWAEKQKGASHKTSQAVRKGGEEKKKKK
jgi:hypothetical protein